MFILTSIYLSIGTFTYAVIAIKQGEAKAFELKPPELTLWDAIGIIMLWPIIFIYFALDR